MVGLRITTSVSRREKDGLTWASKLSGGHARPGCCAQNSCL